MNNNFQDDRHPVHQEVMKSVGTINLTATFAEDTQTLAVFKHIPGVIAMVCTLKKDNEVIGVGRGTAVINRVNRYIEKTVRASVNASLVDAIFHSTKMLDALLINAGTKTGVDEVDRRDNLNLASDKQKKYLREIVRSRTSTLSEKLEWESKIETFTREEASVAIQDLVNKK
jgi:hypothetical protein